jgi:hypothetical protein
MQEDRFSELCATGDHIRVGALTSA